ncbi:hypothetical protein [Arthrobacter agilis]|uniref:hypothetical protein n=1 Tax=Arthrobacter agilis TaxID=37921 RepID=UPI002786F258|nr:hypothetical protein [Arthrobacter agilis]MDQ0735329.1 hypothetical protein [Arthrobacter agilis]
MFPLPDGETVVRVRRRLVLDPYSNEQTLGDWSDPDRLTVEGVAIAASSTVEAVNDSRSQVITQMSIYCGPDEDIRAHDRIEARSGLWEVQGDILTSPNPFTGWSPGSEFAIRKVDG